jgi:hypothetical protein
MAEPVYDEDKEKDLDSLSPDAIRNLEDKYRQGADEAEDSLEEAGYDSEGMAHGGMGRKLRKHSEKQDTEKEEGLNQQLQNTWQNAVQHDKQVGSGYKSSKNKQKNFWQRWRKRRRYLAGAGLIVGSLIACFILLFSFLNVFKLDDMMSNIDAKTFSRFNAAADRRSDRWVQSYLFIRLMQLRGESGADPDSEYFRAYNVSTDNPIRDWYHTLRTSSFEADLAKKGVVFANRDTGNGITFSVLKVNGKEIAGLKAGDIRNGDLVDKLRTNPNFVQDKLGEVDLTKPGANKDARRLIKNVVNDNVRFSQVLKRRQVRKAIQNLTGVRDWRFFETTRDKIDNKKINIRNKLVTKAIPESTLAGKFVRCFFGITSCRFSQDPSDPQYKSESSLVGENNPDKEGDPINDPNGKKIDEVNLGPAADLMKQIIGHANIALNALNITSTLDALSNLNKAITNHQISKGVGIARGVQAMGIYQNFETSRDQIKTGQVTAEEVNKFMQIIGPVSHGEGWTKVITGKGDPSKLTNNASSKQYCSPKNQATIENDPVKGNEQFAYLCADKQVGGPSTAGRLEEDYKNSIGAVLAPILDKYDSIRHAPIIGAVADFLNGIVNTISGVASGLLQDVLKAVGLQDNLESAMAWMVGKVAAFLGAGPIINGNESAPVLTNWLVQGAAFTAEATARANGAMATTATSKVTAQTAMAQYLASKNSQLSVFDKYLALSNPDSTAAKAAFALSDTTGPSMSNKLTDFGSIFRTIGAALVLPFTKHSLAAGDKGYSGADFAAIQTQDYPQQCYNRHPLFQTPQDGTNIQAILGKDKVPDSDLTWDLVDNSSDWYEYVYGKIGDGDNADDIAEKIYDCNLLDTSVRGGTGYTHGYTNDNGLNDNTGGEDTASNTSGGALPTGSAAELASQLKPFISDGKIKCVGFGGHNVGCSDVLNTASGGSIRGGNGCTVDALDSKLLGMLLKLVQMNHTFILSALCSDHSNDGPNGHAGGKAADFNTIDGVFMGPNDTPWSEEKIQAGRKLDQDVASFMPKNTGFGQEGGRCHPHFSFLDGYQNFDDACHHQHIEVDQ